MDRASGGDLDLAAIRLDHLDRCGGLQIAVKIIEGQYLHLDRRRNRRS